MKVKISEETLFVLPLTSQWAIYAADYCRNLSLDDASESDKRDLINELYTMKQLKPHPHVIRLLGCVTESGELFSLTVDERFLCNT